MRRFAIAATSLVALLALGGCHAGPRYVKPAATAPTTAVPTAWKTAAPWSTATPSDSLSKGEWWKIFHDSTLDGYEQQLHQANQSLEAERQTLEQARSLSRAASSTLLPHLSVDPSANRMHYGSAHPMNGATSAIPYTQSVYAVPFVASYEADVFGGLHAGLESSNAQLEATAAAVANARLILESELAANYFTLRELDAEIVVVLESEGYERQGLALVQHRHDGGVASGLEVAQQAALLDATLTQEKLLRQTRAEYEHAIAVLVGQAPSTFAIAAAPLNLAPPAIPLAVPSALLERRPDIAQAERLVAQANAQIGVAHAALYPHINLSLQGGAYTRDLTSLVSAPGAFWAFGGDMLTPIFQGGRLRANLAAAQSAHQASVATYRQTVLTAFQQVEDGLSDLSTLSEAAQTQQAAVEDARKQLTISNNRYVGGITTYLDVIAAQSTLLANQRLATQILGQRLVASVHLIQALGGGWQASEIQGLAVKPEARQLLKQ